MKTVLYGECFSEEEPVLAPSPAHLFSSPIVSHHSSFVSSCVYFFIFDAGYRIFGAYSPLCAYVRSSTGSLGTRALMAILLVGNLADGTLLSDAQRHLVAAPAPAPLLSHTALPDQSICVRTYMSHSLRPRLPQPHPVPIRPPPACRAVRPHAPVRGGPRASHASPPPIPRPQLLALFSAHHNTPRSSVLSPTS